MIEQPGAPMLTGPPRVRGFTTATLATVATGYDSRPAYRGSDFPPRPLPPRALHARRPSGTPDEPPAAVRRWPRLLRRQASPRTSRRRQLRCSAALRPFVFRLRRRQLLSACLTPS